MSQKLYKVTKEIYDALKSGLVVNLDGYDYVWEPDAMYTIIDYETPTYTLDTDNEDVVRLKENGSVVSEVVPPKAHYAETAGTAANAEKASKDDKGDKISDKYATLSGMQSLSSSVSSLQTTVANKANDSNVVHKTGDETIYGTKTIGGGITMNPATAKIVANKNDNIKPERNQIWSSPVPKYLWHDILSFGMKGTPTVETSTDGESWVATTDVYLTKVLFINKEASRIEIINDNTPNIRWTWNHNEFSYCEAAWLAIGVCHDANPATVETIVECSTDGTTWRTLHISSENTNQAPRWFLLDHTQWQGANWCRITMKRISDSGTIRKISNIKLLTSRWGDQGKGSEYEYPYNWDHNLAIYPRTDSSQNLGHSGNKWKETWSKVGFFDTCNVDYLRPKKDSGNNDIGASDRYWSNAYINNITAEGEVRTKKIVNRNVIENYKGHIYGGYLEIHPDSNKIIIPFFESDIAFLQKKGGSCTTTGFKTGGSQTESLFDGTTSYTYYEVADKSDVVSILVKTEKNYLWTTRVGIGFGGSGWGAKDIKIELGYATEIGGDPAENAWTTVLDEKNYPHATCCTTPCNGPSTGGNGNPWNTIRITLTNFPSTNVRIAGIFAFTLHSNSLASTLLSKKGDVVYGAIEPYATDTVNFGSTYKRWKDSYTKNLHADTVESNYVVPVTDNYGAIGASDKRWNSIVGTKIKGNVIYEDGIELEKKYGKEQSLQITRNSDIAQTMCCSFYTLTFNNSWARYSFELYIDDTEATKCLAKYVIRGKTRDLSDAIECEIDKIYEYRSSRFSDSGCEVFAVKSNNILTFYLKTFGSYMQPKIYLTKFFGDSRTTYELTQGTWTTEIPEATFTEANVLDYVQKQSYTHNYAAKVYGFDNQGTQNVWNVGTTAAGYTIPYRHQDGQLTVGTPTADEHATTKAYVDTNYIPKKSINNAYQAIVDNSDATFTVTAGLSNNTGQTKLTIAPSGIATINDKQIAVVDDIPTKGTGVNNYAAGNHTHSSFSEDITVSENITVTGASNNIVALYSSGIDAHSIYPSLHIEEGTTGSKFVEFGTTQMYIQDEDERSAGITIDYPFEDGQLALTSDIPTKGTGANNYAAGNHTHSNYVNTNSIHIRGSSNTNTGAVPINVAAARQIHTWWRTTTDMYNLGSSTWAGSVQTIQASTMYAMQSWGPTGNTNTLSSNYGSALNNSMNTSNFGTNAGTMGTSVWSAPCKGDFVIDPYGCIGVIENLPLGTALQTAYPVRLVYKSNTKWNYTCVEEGTLITMSDGTYRPVEELDQGDLIMGWDFENDKQIEAVTLFARQTQNLDKMTYMIFDNGEYISFSAEHELYSKTHQKYMFINDLKEGDIVMGKDGEDVEIMSIHRDIWSFGRKNFYQVVSSNNTYFANNILNAMHPINKLNWVQYGLMQEIPQEIMEIFVEDCREFDCWQFLIQDKTFLKETVSIQREMKLRSNRIDELKQYLAKTDYVALKYSEGELVDTSIIEQRQASRLEINKLEDELKNQYQPEYNELLTSHALIGEDILLSDTERQIKYFRLACKRDNENLELFKKYYPVQEKVQVDWENYITPITEATEEESE